MGFRMRRPQPGYNMRPRRRSFAKGRIMIALVVAGFAFFSYLSSAKLNPVTGEKQYLSLSTDQEIAMGLQATPQLIQQYGGLYPSQKAQDLVDGIGQELLRANPKALGEWNYDFHLLADAKTVNAFALPGGQVFITQALFSQLSSKAQVAGVLGHEIGHVVARHSAQRIAKQNLTKGLLTSVLLGSGGGASTMQAAQMLGQMINMKYGRGDELQSDELGVDFMAKAGYDPTGMIGVMEVLAAAAGGAGKQADFFSTHPNPKNRVGKIKERIAQLFPQGVPSHFKK